MFEGENNVVLISFPGFAKNQEDEISDFNMSHWKQVVFKERTLKFKPGDNEGGRKTRQYFRHDKLQQLSLFSS